MRRPGTADVVDDAGVVAMAAARRPVIWTCDADDLSSLVGQSGVKPASVVRGV